MDFIGIDLSGGGLLLIVLIVVALAFDFLNGLHDAANSIATIVSTRVLRPRYAVAWAAAFNFIAGSEVFDHLEKVLDRFEDVSNGINGILIEHL